MAGILRGDILWADLNPVKGHEQAGLRPVLILSPEIFNLRSETVIAMALTSQPQKAGETIDQAAKNPIWTEPVSWGTALTVWWAFAWRSVLIFFPVYMIGMIPLKLLSSREIIPEKLVLPYLQIILLTATCVTGIVVMRMILSKKNYKNFLIFVVSKM